MTEKTVISSTVKRTYENGKRLPGIILKPGRPYKKMCIKEENVIRQVTAELSAHQKSEQLINQIVKHLESQSLDNRDNENDYTGTLKAKKSEIEGKLSNLSNMLLDDEICKQDSKNHRKTLISDKELTEDTMSKAQSDKLNLSNTFVSIF